MGLYLPNAEMPINCGECMLRVCFNDYYDAEPVYCNAILETKDTLKQIGIVGKPMNSRDPDCPLLEFSEHKKSIYVLEKDLTQSIKDQFWEVSMNVLKSGTRWEFDGDGLPSRNDADINKIDVILTCIDDGRCFVIRRRTFFEYFKEERS